MTIIERLSNAIQGELPLEEQLATMAQFDSITDAEIEQLFNCHKSFEVGYLLEYLGPTRLQKYLPQFLQFLQDINWPGAGGAARMFRAAGEMAVPEVRRVFREENDSWWNYWIVLNVIDFWKTEVVVSLKQDLLYLIDNPDNVGTATYVFRILNDNKLLGEEELDGLYQQLRKDYESIPLDEWSGDRWPTYRANLIAELDEVMQELL
jgi:hypothetical protein